MSSDHLNNILINTLNSDIILDHQIKTPNSWVTELNSLWASNDQRAVSATALPKKNINNHYTELGHPSEAITQSTTKALGIQATNTFKPVALD